ncbi:hypothetical protein [Bacillus sp. FJAT-27264]|uniref:hypothetical protein n=1 Tax=Paenibacillus sp. (strain DSM 101736 / FJAT-27264) TaxID=1850362 RepID=UPI00158664C7|nr:hypothetical protein [Bacillus sp. FJAT-27264]
MNWQSSSTDIMFILSLCKELRPARYGATLVWEKTNKSDERIYFGAKEKHLADIKSRKA